MSQWFLVGLCIITLIVPQVSNASDTAEHEKERACLATIRTLDVQPDVEGAPDEFTVLAVRIEGYTCAARVLMQLIAEAPVHSVRCDDARVTRLLVYANVALGSLNQVVSKYRADIGEEMVAKLHVLKNNHLLPPIRRFQSLCSTEQGLPT